MELFEFLIMMVLVIAVVLVALKMMQSGNKDSSSANKSKDLSAQKACAKPLAAARRFASLRRYEVIAPARLAKNGTFADLDFIIVGAFGLLCVKCIGLGGEIYGSVQDEKWLQVIGDKRISFDNPIKKAAADTRLVRDTLFHAKMKNVQVETVCVFTNPKTTLALPRGTGHLLPKDFSALLGKSKYDQDKNVDIAAATAAVKTFLYTE